MFENLMVLFDFSWRSRHALVCGLKFAVKFRSQLTVAYALDRDEARVRPEEMERAIRSEIKNALKHVDVHDPSTLKEPRVETPKGRPAPVLLALIEKEKPDLVFLGTDGTTSLPQVLLGSVAEKIVRHSPSPVFVTRKADFPPRSALIPVDGEDEGEEALLLVAELKNAFSFPTELLHVVEPPGPLAYLPEAAVVPQPYDPEAAEREALARLGKIAGRHPFLSLINHVVSGNPFEQICRKARIEGTDLILIPTHGRTGLPRLLIGSVAEQVVRYAPCHVLTFRPGKFLKR